MTFRSLPLLSLPLALAACSLLRPPAPEPEPPPPPATPVETRPSLPPFDATLTDDGPGRGLEPRRLLGYDPALPGYVVEAEMGTLAFRAWPGMRPPDSLVLVLHTSEPRLEHLALTTPTASVETSWDAEEETYTGPEGRPSRSRAGTFFRLAPFEGGVRVVLRPPAVGLLREAGGRVEWVDVFR